MSEIHDAAPPRKGESSAKRAERIEGAIRAARAVAATPEARELHRRSAKLRERGEISTPYGPYRIKGES